MKQNQKKRRELNLALQKFYQKPATRFSLELFLSIGLTLFLVVVAIQPTLITMTELTKEINEKQEINDALPKKIVALNSAQAELLSVQDQLPLLDEALPENIDIVHYLKIIEYEASQHSLIINGISLSHLQGYETPASTKTSATSANQQLVNLTINVDGSYQDIKSFIQALENSRAVFLVNSVSFTKKKINNKPHLLANITVSIPYFVNQPIKKTTRSR